MDPAAVSTLVTDDMIEAAFAGAQRSPRLHIPSVTSNFDHVARSSAATAAALVNTLAPPIAVTNTTAATAPLSTTGGVVIEPTTAAIAAIGVPSTSSSSRINVEVPKFSQLEDILKTYAQAAVLAAPFLGMWDALGQDYIHLFPPLTEFSTHLATFNKSGSTGKDLVPVFSSLDDALCVLQNVEKDIAALNHVFQDAYSLAGFSMRERHATCRHEFRACWQKFQQITRNMTQFRQPPFGSSEFRIRIYRLLHSLPDLSQDAISAHARTLAAICEYTQRVRQATVSFTVCLLTQARTAYDTVRQQTTQMRQWYEQKLTESRTRSPSTAAVQTKFDFLALRYDTVTVKWYGFLKAMLDVFLPPPSTPPSSSSSSSSSSSQPQPQQQLNLALLNPSYPLSEHHLEEEVAQWESYFTHLAPSSSRMIVPHITLETLNTTLPAILATIEKLRKWFLQQQHHLNVQYRLIQVTTNGVDKDDVTNNQKYYHQFIMFQSLLRHVQNQAEQLATELGEVYSASLRYSCMLSEQETWTQHTATDTVREALRDMATHWFVRQWRCLQSAKEELSQLMNLWFMKREDRMLDQISTAKRDKRERVIAVLDRWLEQARKTPRMAAHHAPYLYTFRHRLHAPTSATRTTTETLPLLSKTAIDGYDAAWILEATTLLGQYVTTLRDFSRCRQQSVQSSEYLASVSDAKKFWTQVIPLITRRMTTITTAVPTSINSGEEGQGAEVFIFQVGNVPRPPLGGMNEDAVVIEANNDYG